MRFCSDQLLLWLLRLSACLCFAGWAWGHLYWEGPYGALLWDDSTYELAEHFGVTWDEFAGTGANDGLVQQWLGRVGWIYASFAALAISARRHSWFQMAALACGSLLLTFLAYAQYVGSQYQPPMLIEHAGQILAPILLVLALRAGVRSRATVWLAVVAIIGTFLGHGLYALSVWPTPSTFHAMTAVISGWEHETVVWFLLVAGALDLAVCVGILVPLTRRTCAAWAATWGLLTAAARPVAGMSWNLNYWAADQFLHESVLRAPHFLIPLYLFLVWQPGKNDANLRAQPDRNSGAAPATV